jgi:L-ribulose-5-phosphate 4-epimerase
MLPFLRHAVLDANRALGTLGLAPFTFGNASAIDRGRGLVVVKPSGVAYDTMTADDLVVTDLDGNVVDGKLRPSSDLATHLVLYRAFEAIGGVVHTHSHFATVWSQARREIPCFGTTHADYFHGPVPVTEDLTPPQIASAYEANTGQAIVRRFTGIDPLATPAVLVASHASFCWGETVQDAVHTAAVLEEVARLAYHTVSLAAEAQAIDGALHDKHFLRKHGPDAYYGQPS